MENTFFVLNNKTCTRLKLYSEDLKNLLLANNWEISSNPSLSQYIFVNTCAFTGKKEDDAIKTIVNLQKNYSNKKIIIIGCLPYINPARLQRFFSGQIITSRTLDELITLLKLKPINIHKSYVIFNTKQSLLSSICKYIPFNDAYWRYQYNKEKVFHIKISEGCMGKCSYCAEKIARGKLESREIREILLDFKSGLSLNYKIFSLNADDTSVFGFDNGENIADLLIEILKIKQNFKLIITEFNPKGLMLYPKIKEILKSEKIAGITVPIQSGSDKILVDMKREYIINEIVPFLKDIKRSNPKININTHFIIGFPGETEIDFALTQGVAHTINFSKIKVFKYSERSKTASFNIFPKIDNKTIHKRFYKLRLQILFNALITFNFKKFLLNLQSISEGIN